jgi:DNA-binding GntR family transcriptional regulator
VVKPSDLVKSALGLPDEQFVIYLERLRYGDDEPIALMHNYIPTSLVTLSNEMLEEHGLYELLRASGIFPFSATQRISAKNATTIEARSLNETKGTALLTMERTTFDERGRALEFAQHVYRASRYALLSTVAIDDPTREQANVTSIDSSY